MRIQGLPVALMAGNRMTLSTQTTSGLMRSQMRRQPLMGDDGAVDDRLPDRHHVGRQAGRIGESRKWGRWPAMKLAQNFATSSSDMPPDMSTRFSSKPYFSNTPLKPRSQTKTGLWPMRLQLLGDADAIQRRAEGGLRIEHDGFRSGFGAGHGLPLTIPPAKVAWGQAPGQVFSPLLLTRFPVSAGNLQSFSSPFSGPSGCEFVSQSIRKLRSNQAAPRGRDLRPLDRRFCEL